MPSKLMFLALGCCWAQYARFFIEKKVYIASYSVYITIHFVYMLEGGRNGWMAVDSVGCSCHFWNFQIRQDMVDLVCGPMLCTAIRGLPLLIFFFCIHRFKVCDSRPYRSKRFFFHQ